MAKTFKAVGIIAAIMLAGASIVWANGIKVWSASEKISSTDLNANFAHLHNSLRGAGHTLITNGDISAGAVIAHSKLATPALVPKGWVVMEAACPSADAGIQCTVTSRAGTLTTSSIYTGSGSIGVYRVVFSAPFAAGQLLQAQSLTPAADIYPSRLSDGGVQLNCYAHDAGTGDPGVEGPLAGADCAFNLVHWSN